MAVGEIPRVKQPYTAPSLERMPIERTANANSPNGDTQPFTTPNAFPAPGAS